MKKFLVVYEIDGEETEPKIETDLRIFDVMDMDDCYDISIKYLYYLKENPFELIRCIFRGSWHDGHAPLKMAIVSETDNEIISIGYGTDH